MRRFFALTLGLNQTMRSVGWNSLVDPMTRCQGE